MRRSVLSAHAFRKSIVVLLAFMALSLPLIRMYGQEERLIAQSKEPSILTQETGGRITVQAAERGKPFLNLWDGREMRVSYRGDQASVANLQSGLARARSLA